MPLGKGVNMCVNYYRDRVYARRRRDGRLFRFDSRRDMVSYSRREHESKRSLPIITRSELIAYKRSYSDPRWLKSIMDEGTAMLVETGA